MIGKALMRADRKAIGGASNLVDPNEIPWSILPESSWLNGGTGMSIHGASGLPAVLAVLMRLAYGVGLTPAKVYEGPAPEREEAVGSWQYELLHDRPSSEVPPATFFANLAVQVAGAGYGCVRKWKGSSGRVRELQVLDSARVTPRRVGGQLVFEDRSADDRMPVTRTADEIIYVPAVSLNGGPVGMSPLTAHRLTIQLGLRRRRFELDHYANGAQAGTILSFPSDLTATEARGWVDAWDEGHANREGAFRTAAIGGGAAVTTMPISLVDAQFVEATQMTAGEVGAVYAMPRPFLNIGDPPTELDWRFFATFCVGPYTTTIDQAFNADRDLFPDASGLMVEHLTDALLKPDIRTRYEAYKAARQAGWMTSNEIRRRENMPPHDDGDMLQVIPVGGGEPRGPSGQPGTEAE